jgi:archaemetzincin
MRNLKPANLLNNTGPEAISAHLDIIPLGKVDPLALSVVAANLKSIMGINARILPPRPDPLYAFMPMRNQYDAGKILLHLADIKDGARFRLGVAHLDIFTPILTFVFGESQLGGNAAIVSLFRIHDPDPALIYERAAKIALHEIGHLIGIVHCRTPDCLMGFSSNLERLDGLPLRFCSACEYEASCCLSRLLKNP